MNKNALREEMRAKRRLMTYEEVRAKSSDITRALLSLECMQNAQSVCTFLSAFKEPDIAEVAQYVLSSGKKLVVPLTDEESNTLSLSYISSLELMQKGAYGIREPKTVLPADESTLDVVLVPGLAFDRQGGRTGFGKGYYDRLLTNTAAVKIGLCYDFQLCEKIPTEKHDVKMDFIITEKEILEIR